MSSITILELKKKIQDRGLLFWTIILPVLFTVLFISVLTAGEEGEGRDAIVISIVPGYVVMFTFFIMITMCLSFLDDQHQGVTARIASTPISPLSYLLGKWMPYMFVIIVQIVILFVFGKLVYDIPLEQPLQLFILSVFLAFTVTGIGLAIAMIVKTGNMGIAITQVVALGGAILGGLWFPIDMVPAFIQTISRFLPQYWSHQAFQKAMTGTLSNTDFYVVILILCGFGVGGLIIALLRYPVFLKQARS